MPAGFMTEHTAEYALVPDLIGRLSGAFTRIVPFFFSASREGQAKAQLSYEGEVKLLCAYARRPKVNYPGEGTIHIKFNELLFHHASALEQAGIPLLAGVPCVSRLTDFHLGVECAWFHIEANKLGGSDAYAEINITPHKQVILKNHNLPLRGPLTDKDIHQLALENSRPVMWSQALHVLAEINRELKRGSETRTFWLGGVYLPYKPFYLALIDDDV